MTKDFGVKDQLIIDDPRASPVARGNRLRRLRNLANLEREDICKDIEISPHTYKGWEIARHGGLTKSGAEKVLQVLSKHGVICSIDWLMYEIGKGPKLFDEDLPATGQINLINEPNIEDDLLAEEIALFRIHYPDSSDYLVLDNSMEPSYHEGDYVAGLNCYGQQIEKCIGHICIIELETGHILLRELHKGSVDGTYSLLCKQISPNIEQPIIYNITIKKAAPVIWMRRKFPIQL